MSQKATYRLLTLLAIVAILLTGCGSKKTLKDQILAKWECVDPQLSGSSVNTVTFEFMSGGKATLTMGPASVNVTYKWVSDKTMELTIDLGTGNPETQQMDVSINGNKLSLTAQGQTVECTKK